MKSYDETARTVLDRVHAYERAQVRRRTAMVRGAVTLCCLGIVFGLGFLFLRHGDGFRPHHVISGTDTSHTDPTDDTTNTTNTDLTTDSNHTDTNVTDTGIGSTDTGTNSTDTSTSTSTNPSDEPLFNAELAAKADAVIFIGGGSAGEDSELLTKNEIKFYLASHKLLDTDFQSKTTEIAYPSNAIKSATFTMEGISHPVTFKKAEQLPLANCNNEYLKQFGTLLVGESENGKYTFCAATEELRYYFRSSQGGNVTPLADDVAKAKAEAVLRELYGNDFEDGYVFYNCQMLGRGSVYVMFYRYLHGVLVDDYLIVTFRGDEVMGIDARKKDYFGDNSKDITKEMVDRAIESMRIYLGLETLSKGACQLTVNEDGRYFLKCVTDNEYWVELK